MKEAWSLELGLPWWGSYLPSTWISPVNFTISSCALNIKILTFPS